MKIIQEILLEGNVAGTGSVSAVDVYAQTLFYKSHFTEITAAYFEIEAWVNNAGYPGVVELYDVDASSVIASINVTSTTHSRLRSADFKALLPEGHVLTVRGYVPTGDTSQYVFFTFPRFFIYQDDEGEQRNTETYYSRVVAGASSGNLPYANAFQGYLKINITGNDGIIVPRFEVSLKTTAGGNAFARLYDTTAGAPVTGSEVTTNSAAFVNLESGEIAIVDGHEYVAQVRNDTASKFVYYQNIKIKIRHQNFQKVTTIALAMRGTTERLLFDRDFITGLNGLEFKLRQLTIWADVYGGSGEWAIQNYTDTEDISGTGHTSVFTGYEQKTFDDVPVMPTSSKEINARNGASSNVAEYPYYLEVIQVENFPIPPWEWNEIYPFIGLRVHGALRRIAVFKEYWYGRRADRIWIQPEKRTGKQQGWWTYYAQGVYNWQHFDSQTKSFYNKMIYPKRLYGYHRYLKQFLLAQEPMIIFWENLEKSVGDSSTIDEAIAAAIAAAKLVMYPVGSIYISTASTDPAGFLGGTWAAFGAGRVLVSRDAGDADFDVAEETGGAKTRASSAQGFGGTPSTDIVNHKHTTTHMVGTTDGTYGTFDSSSTTPGTAKNIQSGNPDSGGVASYTPAGTNTPGAATSVVQPYIVVYMFKRTA